MRTPEYELPSYPKEIWFQRSILAVSSICALFPVHKYAKPVGYW